MIILSWSGKTEPGTANIWASVTSNPNDPNDQKDFGTSVAMLKNLKFQWDASKKIWWKPAAVFSDMQATKMGYVTKVYYPDDDRNLANTWKPFSELETYPEIPSIDYSVLCKGDYRPIKGKAPYENFQDEDIRKALSQNRFLFNWTMGLGKSFATTIIYEYLHVYKDVPKMLLLTSKVGTFNLRDELAKFGKHIEVEDVAVFADADSLTYTVETADKNGKKKKTKTRAIFNIPEICNKKVLVFSYGAWETLCKDYGDSTKISTGVGKVPLDKFFQCPVDKWLLCLDECHYLSNVKSGRTKVIARYFRYFKYRYLFSATPADKYEKLYSLCRTLDPALVKGLKFDMWLQKYNDIGTFFSKYALNPRGWHQQEIAELNYELLKYSAKRETKDVMDLPDYYKIETEVEMSEKQAKLYKDVTNALMQSIAAKKQQTLTTVSDIIKYAFTTISSLTANPNLLGVSNNEDIPEELKNLCKDYNYAKDYAKLVKVDDILEDEDERDQRGIIWYIHPLTKDVIVERYKKYKPIVISAELSSEERDKALKEFKINKEHKVLIASQNILATSITLTECTYAVYLETSYSYETYLQSTGRIYRIGQKDPVRIYHIWMKDTVDGLQKETLERKQEIVNDLFNKLSKSFTLQNLKKILTGQVDI